MSIKILNIFLIAYLLFLKEVLNALPSDDPQVKLNLHYEEEIKRIRSMYMKDTESVFDKNIDLFLPKFDFQRPEKFRKEAYSKIYRYSSDYKNKTESPKDTFIFPESIIEEYEGLYRKDLLDSLIKKEVSMEDFNFNSKYEIFGFPDAKRIYNEEPKYVNLQDPNAKMRNFAEISHFIQFDPKELLIVDKPICIPTMTLFNVKNTMSENLILRSIKSDLYQVTIFYFRPGRDANQSYNQKNIYPKTLLPGETMIFQIILLPDMTGQIKGNIYLEFNDNKVVVYPLVINAVENIYRVNPIYSPNWQGSKLLQTPISIYNPHSKTLIVKEVINSFSSINLVWPNGQPVSSNHTSISSSMLEIPPKTTKNLMMINFYKEVPGVEYGLLQMKTDKDTLIIPVLIRVEIQGIKIFPSYFNFGLVDLNRDIKRLIPITVTNVSKHPLQIKTIYAAFEENLIEFIPNTQNTNCPSIINNKEKDLTPASNLFDLLGNNVNGYNPDFCVINAEEEQITFGYLMLDPLNYKPDVNDSFLYKKVKGSIILQTNFTENPFVELAYEYYLDKDTFIIVNESGKLNKTVTNIMCNPSGNNNNNNHNLFYVLGSNAKESYKYEITTKIKSPLTFNIVSSTLSYLEDDSKSNNLKDLDRINIIPESNQITTRFKESNDTLKLNLVLDNPNSFVNKKNYFFAVKTNLNLITLIPVRFFDQTLDLHYCDEQASNKDCQGEFYKGINLKNTALSIDFGIISTTETGKRYFSILNDNEDDLLITDIDSTKVNLILGIESVYNINTDEKIALIPRNHRYDNGRLQNYLRKKILKTGGNIFPLIVMAGTYTTFSIEVSSQVEGNMNSILTVEFERGIKLAITATVKFLKGNLNISPSLIRFEPAFPGFYQSKLVSSKSSYSIPINIYSVASKDQRIIPVLLTNSIISNNRTEILKVLFDPSKVALEENFMKGGENFLNVSSRYLTYKELYLWKEKQKLWELLGSLGRTEINTSVKIKTNIQSETVNVRAFLTKPSLVKKDEIDFGLIQLGDTQSRYIEVFNPSDEPMVIQVLLASEEFSDIYNNTMFTRNKKFRFTSDNGITMMDCHFFNTSSFDPLTSNFTQNLISQKYVQKKNKKKKSEDDIIGSDTTNSIIIEEDIPPTSINNKSIGKVELIKKLFLYANQNLKTNFVLTKRMICNSNFMNKNEIILNNYKELTERIFSDEFTKEIPIVKFMTDCNPPTNQKREGKEASSSFFERIAQFLKIFFRTDTMRKRKLSENDRFKSQEFYLPKIVSSQLYNIKPHQKLKIGPIIFTPASFSNNSATLFIKNNLTMLYPIKLKGSGGSGKLNFSINEKDSKNITKEIKVENRLLIDINNTSIDLNNEIITRTLILKNTGNLPVKINNISIENYGCEAFGIKIQTCELITLKPDETFNIQILIKPDFNFYFLEKDLIFETQMKTVVLKISIKISNELLSYKNRLFNTDYLKNYGYISIFVVIFIVSVILYILSVEYAEIKDKQVGTIQFISSKEIIENSPMLKFENLFIKAYRKFNHGFYDDFVNKQIDKPGTGNYEIDLLGEKRKSSNKVSRDSRERRSEDLKDIDNSEDKKNEEKKTMNVNLIDTVTKDTTNKANINYKKDTTNAKVKPTKKVVAKKPIGMGLKANEKRDESETTTNNIVNNAGKKVGPTGANLTNATENSMTQNKLDHVNQMNYQKMGKDYLNSKEEPFNTQNVDNSNSSYNQHPIPENSAYSQGYWPKVYGGYYGNNKQIQAAQGQARYDYNTNNTTNVNTNFPNNNNNYYQNPNYYSYPNSNITPPNVINPNPNTVNANTVKGSIYENTNNSFKSSLNSNQSKLNEPVGNNNSIYETVVKNEGKKMSRDLNENKSTKEVEKEIEISNEINNFNKSINNNNNNNNKPIVSASNLKEQFMAFVPDYFNKKLESNKNNQSQSEKNLIDNEKSVTTINNQNQNKEIQLSGQQNENEFNLNSFKSNFDFSNIFTKPEHEAEVEVEVEDILKVKDKEQIKEKENVSEMEDVKNLQDEDGSSHNYQSEKEKFGDSGTEDFKFNFNSIFNQNSMKFTINYDNDYTDNDEVQPKDGNKPYFDKSLFFSFDSAFNNNKPALFAKDPFAANTNKQSLLSELRDDDVTNNVEIDHEEQLRRNKLDDVAENEGEYDDEEDPVWDTEDFDPKKEGFFNETGEFKLKQMDFNFDYGINKMKKN